LADIDRLGPVMDRLGWRAAAAAALAVAALLIIALLDRTLGILRLAVAAATPRIAAIAIHDVAEGHGTGHAAVAAVATVSDGLLRRRDDDRRALAGPAVSIAVAIGLDRAVAALPAA